MVKFSRKLLTIGAGVVVAASGLAALQMSRPEPAASAARPNTVPPTAAALDLAAPQLVKPVRPARGQPQTAEIAPRPPVRPMPDSAIPRTYQVLLERSVFSNQPPRRMRPGEEGRGGSRSYEASLTFRGAMRDGDDIVAFIDDGSTRTMRLKVGDKLGRGEIRAISLNQLLYQLGDRTVPVEIGMNLTGTGIMATTRPSAPAPSEAKPDSGPSASPDSSSSPGLESIIEKMRKRRQQQEGGS